MLKSLKLNGIVPLMMHNNRAANPLSVYAKAMKSLTSKRNKTDSDFEEIARMEWETGLYIDNGVVVLPEKCITKCFLMGARKSKDGKKFETGVFLPRQFYPIEYTGPKIKLDTGSKNYRTFPNPDLDKYYKEFCDQDMVKVGTNQVLRTRPIFNGWSCVVEVEYDETVLDERTLIHGVEKAGYLVGLLEQRPRLGRFTVEVLK